MLVSQIDDQVGKLKSIRRLLGGLIVKMSLLFSIFLILLGVVCEMEQKTRSPCFAESIDLTPADSVICKKSVSRTNDRPQTDEDEKWFFKWEKPPNISGTKPRLRCFCFRIKFLRRDQNVVEFISVDNYGKDDKGTHCKLRKSENQGGRLWIGKYTHVSSGDAGYLKFDEFIGKNGEMLYIGEHSGDERALEWIPSIIERRFTGQIDHTPQGKGVAKILELADALIRKQVNVPAPQFVSPVDSEK